MKITYTDYIESLREKLRYTYKLASTKADQSRQKQKGNYDKRVRQSVIDIGDRVLIKRTGFTGKHKLANKWENIPYVVVEQPSKDIPVYRLKEEGGVQRRFYTGISYYQLDQYQFKSLNQNLIGRQGK